MEMSFRATVIMMTLCELVQTTTVAGDETCSAFFIALGAYGITMPPYSLYPLSHHTVAVLFMGSFIHARLYFRN